jgi:F-box-like
MSALDSTPISLCEDVLLMIFQHLDGQDLLQCEAVCRQWRQALLTGTSWRRWLNRRAKSPELRPFCQKVELEESNHQFTDYRAICRDILRSRNRLDSNWLLGKYEESSTIMLDDLDCVAITDNSIYSYFDLEENNFIMDLNKTTLEFAEVRKYVQQDGFVKFYKDIAIFNDSGNIQLRNCTDGHVLNEIPVNDRYLLKCCFNGTFLALYLWDNCCHLWRVEIGSKSTWIKTLETCEWFKMEGCMS